MTWNHRIMRYPNGELGIHEVYYDEDGDISWTKYAVACYGFDIQDLRLGYELMERAFKLPILDYDLGDYQGYKYMWE